MDESTVMFPEFLSRARRSWDGLMESCLRRLHAGPRGEGSALWGVSALGGFVRGGFVSPVGEGGQLCVCGGGWGSSVT